MGHDVPERMFAASRSRGRLAVIQAKQVDSAAALAAQNEAHKQGLWHGGEIGAAGMLGLFVVFLAVRRLSRTFTITKKSQAASVLELRRSHRFGVFNRFHPI